MSHQIYLVIYLVFKWSMVEYKVLLQCAGTRILVDARSVLISFLCRGRPQSICKLLMLSPASAFACFYMVLLLKGHFTYVWLDINGSTGSVYTSYWYADWEILKIAYQKNWFLCPAKNNSSIGHSHNSLALDMRTPETSPSHKTRRAAHHAWNARQREDSSSSFASQSVKPPRTSDRCRCVSTRSRLHLNWEEDAPDSGGRKTQHK